mgnify:CR=1 FL=1
MRENEAKKTDALKQRPKPDINFLVVPPVGCLPDSRILENRKRYFLPAKKVHLFADDFFNLFYDAEPERQEAVDTRHLFMDIPGANQKLSILRHFVFWRFAAGFGE